MDAEVRALVHALAADHRDHTTGLALARAVARAEAASRPRQVEAVPIPPEWGVGKLVLVVRASRPRPLFAWPEGADAAIGRTGRVRKVAADGLSCEIEVVGVGRFHVGAASLYAVPDLRGESELTPEERALFAEPLRAGKNDLGALGMDGLTDLQRALFRAAPDVNFAPNVPAREVAEAAGFVVDNNRPLATAFTVIPTLRLERGTAVHEVLNVSFPELLGGEVGPGETQPWTHEDVWIAQGLRAGTILGGLPWAVVAGLRTGALIVPPHDAREVGGALLLLLEKPMAKLDDVIRVMPGPDFGTGHRGHPDAIKGLYETGQGSLVLRTSFEIVLPTNIIITVPEPESAPTAASLLAIVEEAVQASRLEGVDTVRAPQASTIEVHAQRGADLLALRRQLENILPREREVHFKLPLSLVDWLHAFLDDRRKTGASDADLRRAIHAARPPARPPRGRARP